MAPVDVTRNDQTRPLSGRVAVVTGGAGKGVGRATVLALAREGADVIINTHHSLDSAHEVAEQVRRLGQRAIVVGGDAADPDVVDEMVRRARAELGEPLIVVASAGGRWIPRPIEEIQPVEWREALREEIDGPYLMIRATLPAMRQASWGRIVLVGGYDADGWSVPPEVGPIDYALGKAARHWLVRTLARHEARHGVTLNAVAPGPITRLSVEAIFDAVAGRLSPGHGVLTQVDVAEAIVRLCLDGSVNGAIVSLPGPNPGSVTPD